jgi:glycosyltransferase involved in cell wall biosynthesis
MFARSVATHAGQSRAPERPVATPASSLKVVIFGSARPVTCAVMDYARRLHEAIEAQRPGFVAIETIEPGEPFAFVAAVVKALRAGAVAHFELPIEGWGDSVVPGSALMAARLVTRRGRIAVTMHEWASLNRLRYLSTIPDLLAADGFVFVSPRQREGFLSTPWVAQAKKDAAPVIPIGPNVMSTHIDATRVAQERAKTRGEGALRADVVVGFFGVLYASKRPDLLLRVVASLRDRGAKARLLVCGDFLWDKPHDRAAFLELARELGVAEWLDFRGRIDDQGELLATLSASDVFLLPYTDGVSARRSSFQAVSQLAIPLVTTEPERPDEFDLIPALREKIDNPATALVPVDAGPEDFAAAVMTVLSQKERAVGVSLDAIWREAAARHLAFYDRLLERSGVGRGDRDRRVARWLDAAE